MAFRMAKSGLQTLGLKKKYPEKTDKRLLMVNILEAKDLLGVADRGRSCDSCVKIELKDLGGRTVDKEADGTVVKRGTRNPAWNEEFQIGTVLRILLCVMLPCVRLATFPGLELTPKSSFLRVSSTSYLCRSSLQYGQC